MKKYSILLYGMLLLNACNTKTETPTTTNEIQNSISLTDQQLKNIDLEIVNLQQGAIPNTIRLNARTESRPEDRVSISNIMGGFIKSIQVLPGELVTKGQVLAILEDPSYIQLQEDYLSTKALLVQATSDFNRQKELNDSQAASTKVLEQARTEMQLLQIKKRAIEEKLQLINIVPSSVQIQTIKRNLALIAPISGIVNEVFSNKGQYVSGSQPILEIIQTNMPLLNIKAFEDNLQFLKIGQELEAYTNQNPTQKIIAKIISITQHVNEDGTVDVLAQIAKNNSMRFTTNMYFNVDLTYESTTANTLPIASIVQFEGKNYVFEASKNNTFIWKEVKTGSQTNTYIQILTPLDTSKKYVGTGAYGLLMAMKNNPE